MIVGKLYCMAASLLLVASVSAENAPTISPERFARASAFTSDALLAKTRNANIVPHWIEGTDRFWFAKQTATGQELVIVDAATGKGHSCDLEPMTCKVATPKTGPLDVVSPDGRVAAFVRDHNLWLRDLASNQERQLTQDGVDAYAYGETAFGDLMRVLRRRTGTAKPPEAIVWSPDSRYIATMRADLRNVPLRPVVTEFAPKDAPFAITHMDRYPIASDTSEPPRTIAVIDAATGETVRAKVASEQLQDYSPVYFAAGVAWWNLTGREFCFLTGTRDGKRYGLAALDLRSGEVRTVIEESEQHYYSLNPYDYARPNVHVSSNGAEAIWYSQRSGYGHLYLYDARRGKLKRQLTQGDWTVFDLVRVDEAKRYAYFVAGGREQGRNPYYRHLYRVSLDGGDPQLLTPEDADHQFRNHYGLFALLYGPSNSQISPSGRYFVDVYSTVNQPPITVVRNAAGRLRTRVVEADISALQASGWRAPEQFVVKAADDQTNLYGVLYRPTDFDARLRYAVIDRMYPGPQGSWAPRSFMDSLAFGYGQHMQALAELGFVVVVLDGRGTSHRDKAFRYAFAGTEDVLGAIDHKAAIEHLAKQNPWLDTDRVGVTGASFGGYGSLRAMLLYPEFFDVGVSMVGPAEYRSMGLSLTVDRFFGIPGRSKQEADYYDLISNTRLVGRLNGKLLLMYGGIDENVPLNQAFLMFEALITANKNFDSLIIPNSTHGVPQHPYAVRRTMEYFAEHLGGPQAPRP